MGSNRCIKNLLKLICLLQENSENDNCLEDGCSKPFLGPNINNSCYNTRVITIYTKNGTLLSSSFREDGILYTSSFFRVEKVMDDCVNLQILRAIDDRYIATNNFITVKIKCICAVKCVVDTIT